MHSNDTCRSGFEGIIGSSNALNQLLADVRAVAPTDSTVFIEGETGTGKELIARAVQQLGLRAAAPFVKINCAAIPGSLLESELMGHERGAFTGAVATRVGRFEQAAGGTIFLDEIGEMPLDLQPKLLRVLQEREFERIGGSATRRCDVRVVAATNCDLQQMVAEHRFREDLYYRLTVLPIKVPPLRERAEDIPLLVAHFAKGFALRMNKQIDAIDPASLERLTRYEWPGNVRELQNVVERAVIFSQQPVLHIPLLLRRPGPAPVRPRDGLAEVNRAHILRILHETNWVVAGPRGAAARLEMKRSTLNFRMKKLGIVRNQPRPPGGSPVDTITEESQPEPARSAK